MESLCGTKGISPYSKWGQSINSLPLPSFFPLIVEDSFGDAEILSGCPSIFPQTCRKGAL